MIAHARVPLLMFVDSELKISCDVSVDNGTALYKSRVLRWITDMDPRCRRLIFLVRILYIISWILVLTIPVLTEAWVCHEVIFFPSVLRG